MPRLSQDGWGIAALLVALCAGVVVGASTDRSARRQGVPLDGSSLIVNKPQVPTDISYSSLSKKTARSRVVAPVVEIDIVKLTLCAS